jgi:hypothetical protein
MKTTKATRYICEAAQRAINGKITVDCDSSYSTVSIDAPGQDGIFMQGDEAVTFIAERDALCKRYPSLNFDTAELALAEPYAECIWG